ncbi:MAG: hypothetical protein SAL07_19285 [Oscillatoria sp. PMC 1051.18]|uniref:hypothetical protein n=1 Tax=Oscillatoria salina TaxID=331517 RepID=UPI0013B8398E|nr:hypothetical protein [Oscillatoria salina]MBZ8182186.1 hypothetical protein [Oscillatoria salina IIICB1]MEC4893698.1 hypothetical protein [Oscillatoria sp. PMC 1050.18]MEC5032048.1 hypothetical protein [Oscillatoria sp. PMC 1051.18]NET90231.1 hypothetical protein [Kamptonema sp. SIO1D9]
MKTTNCLTSACRYCRYYELEGRRGGMCQQLGVPVQANWKACSLALPPFTSEWKELEELVHLEKSLSLEISDNSSKIEATEEEQVVKV